MNNYTKSLEVVDKTLVGLEEIKKNAENILKIDKILTEENEKLSSTLKLQLQASKEIGRLESEISKYSKIRTKEAEEQVQIYRHQIEELEKITISDEERQKQYLDNLEQALKLEDEQNKAAKEAAEEEKEAKLKPLKDVAGYFANKLQTIGKEFISDFKESFKEIMETSFLTNSQTRNAIFQYGFNLPQAQAFNKTMEIMGINSEEDLMYMNPAQAQKFQETMTTLGERYNELYESGFYDDYMAFQVDWQVFKQEFLMEAMKLIIDNKDTIKSAMEAIIKITDIVLTIANAITSNASSNMNSALAAASSDYIESITNSKTTNNISLHNNYSNVDAKDMANIESISHTSYEQIVNALSV